MKNLLKKIKISAYLLPLLAGILWGTTGTTQSFAPQGTSPLAVGTVRIAVGGLALLAYALWKGEMQKITRPWPMGAVITAALGIALCQLLFFAAVAATGVSIGTIVSMGSAPVIAGVLGLFFRREKITCRWLLATSFAIAGCTLIAVVGKSGPINLFGIFLALGAGASYAAYTTATKHLFETQPMTGILAAVFCCGTLFLIPVFYLVDMSWLSSGRGIFVAIHLGVVTTALAFTLFSNGLKKLPIATAATLGLAEPLTAALLGALILGEQLAPSAWLGIMLILLGLTILASTPVKPPMASALSARLHKQRA